MVKAKRLFFNLWPRSALALTMSLVLGLSLSACSLLTSGSSDSAVHNKASHTAATDKSAAQIQKAQLKQAQLRKARLKKAQLKKDKAQKLHRQQREERNLAEPDNTLKQADLEKRALRHAKQIVWLGLSCKDLVLMLQGPDQQELRLPCQPQTQLIQLTLKPGHYRAYLIQEAAKDYPLAMDKTLQFTVPKRQHISHQENIYIGHISFALMHLNKRKVVSGFHIQNQALATIKQPYSVQLARAPDSDVTRFFSYCAKACRAQNLPEMYLKMSPSFDALHCHCVEAGAQISSRYGFFNRFNQVEFFSQ